MICLVLCAEAEAAADDRSFRRGRGYNSIHVRSSNRNDDGSPHSSYSSRFVSKYN